MPLPSAPIPSFQKGSRLLNGSDVQKLSDLIASTQIGITAQADGTKANATQLNAAICEVTSVAGAADSVLLPLGYAGLRVTIINNGGNAMQVFGKGSDTIDDVATGTGVSQADDSLVTYICVKVVSGVGYWYSTGF